jgi:putative tricarboxylic transport membrane protein
MGKDDIISSILWISISAAVLTASVRLGIGPFENPGPGFLGFWAGLLLAILGAAMLAASLSSKGRGAGPADSPVHSWKNSMWRVPLLTGSAMIIYCLALPALGYLPATLLFMAALFGSGGIKLRWAVTGSLTITVLTYVLFERLLKMPLPKGLLSF